MMERKLVNRDTDDARDDSDDGDKRDSEVMTDSNSASHPH